HLAVQRRVLARRARVLPSDHHLEVREVAVMYRTLSVLVAALVLSAASAASAQTAGGACIGDNAKKELAVCPNTGPATFDVGKHGKAPQVNFHSAPQAADLKKRDQAIKP